jgi:hypothetical protein
VGSGERRVKREAGLQRQRKERKVEWMESRDLISSAKSYGFY